jgi:FtsH-binding integral membrane protein
MSRTALRAFALDLACVLFMVVIGTRNHKTDTGITGVLFVAAPFWIAASLAHLAPLLQRSKKTEVHVALVWGYTVVMGMVLRNIVFDRGTAPAFVIVATIFLGSTMYGWRALLARRSISK